MGSTLIITVEAPTLAPAITTDFSNIAKICHGVISHCAEVAGMPEKIEIVLSDNFQNAVCARMRKDSAKYFDPVRRDVHVSGKNLPQDDCLNHVVIVFNATDWTDYNSENNLGKLIPWNTVAHEFSHPALGRLRIASVVSPTLLYIWKFWT